MTVDPTRQFLMNTGVDPSLFFGMSGGGIPASRIAQWTEQGQQMMNGTYNPFSDSSYNSIMGDNISTTYGYNYGNGGVFESPTLASSSTGTFYQGYNSLGTGFDMYENGLLRSNAGNIVTEYKKPSESSNSSDSSGSSGSSGSSDETNKYRYVLNYRTGELTYFDPNNKKITVDEYRTHASKEDFERAQYDSRLIQSAASRYRT